MAPIGHISSLAWRTPRTIRLARLAILLSIAIILGLTYLLLPGVRGELTRALGILATGDGVAIGAYLRSYGVLAPLASLGLMVVQAVAAPVPAILVAFANGLTFGLAAIDGWFTRWGGRGILLLRLAPGISFDVVSFAAGLTGMRFGPFVLATAVGVAPQAFLYAYLILESPQSAWLFFGATWLVIALITVVAFARGKRLTIGARPATAPLRGLSHGQKPKADCQ